MIDGRYKYMGSDIIKDIQEALKRGDRAGVTSFVKQALDSGMDVRSVMDGALIAAMEEIGGRFKRNEIFIPEVLISAKAMHSGMAVLEPHFVRCGIKPIGKVIIGTVKGDLHDIGKNIVSMMMKGSRFDVEDRGIDVSPAKFVEAVRSSGADILAMSSLLTTSMSSMRDTIRALKEANLRDKVRVIVGGAPVTQDFADSIEADAFAKDAASAVDRAKELLRR
jgi:5-methyltetrahydrofolate--homocysteine methyltransferase